MDYHETFPDDIGWVGHFALLNDQHRAILQAAKHWSLPYFTIFKVKIKDLRSGKIYEADEPFPKELEKSWCDRWMLNAHMIQEHFCGCHREPQDCPDPDEECTDGRWLILSTEHETLPGINLYFETVGTN